MSQVTFSINQVPLATGGYAGFWHRFVALTIDSIIVSLAVSVAFLLLAATSPRLGNSITLSMPFKLFTTERTLESNTNISREPKGITLVTTKTIVEEMFAGKWRYVYRVTETKKVGLGTKRSSTTKRQQIDPLTHQDIKASTLDSIIMAALFIYWILMDASSLQGSIGKRAVGLRVVNQGGLRLTIPQAVGRNLFKMLSALIAFIGFAMVSWTRNKQALHDKIMHSYVVRNT